MRAARDCEDANALFMAMQLDAIYTRLAAASTGPATSLADVQRIRWVQMVQRLGPENVAVQAAASVSPLDNTGKALQVYILLLEAEHARLAQEATHEKFHRIHEERRQLEATAKREADRAEYSRVREADRAEIAKLKMDLITLPAILEQKRILEQHVNRLEPATNTLIAAVEDRFRTLRGIFREVADVLHAPQNGVPVQVAERIMQMLNVDKLRRCFAPLFREFINTSGSSIDVRGLADHD